MKDIKAIRRENFRKLVDSLDGVTSATKVLRMSQSHVSQLYSTRAIKNIGDRLARKIEEQGGLVPGSLDLPLSSSGDYLLTVPIVDADTIVGDNYLKRLPALTSPATSPDDQPFVVWDNMNPYTPQGQLFAMYVADSSMYPKLHPNDLVIFDTSIEALRPGCLVVAATQTGHAIMRTLKEAPGGGYDLLVESELFAEIHMDDLSQVRGMMVEIRYYQPIHSPR